MNQLQTTKKAFSKEEFELIRSQIAPEATAEELKLFLYQAQLTGLNPLTRQLYCIHRNVKQGANWVKKMTIQTSIDGFRVIAERSGTYGGQSEPVFTYDKEGKLVSCKVSVFRFRDNVRYEAAVGIAYWDEYAPKNNEGKVTGMWAKMEHTMLAKVAESLALRKSYPQDLSGLYTSEEMNQSDVQNPAYIKKHEIAEDLELAIDLVVSLDELKQLYVQNTEMVEENKAIKKLFSNKKTTL
jgi:phage recombination protein Bet